jgi:hypothetical protein
MTTLIIPATNPTLRVGDIARTRFVKTSRPWESVPNTFCSVGGKFGSIAPTRADFSFTNIGPKMAARTNRLITTAPKMRLGLNLEFRNKPLFKDAILPSGMRLG